MEVGVLVELLVLTQGSLQIHPYLVEALHFPNDQGLLWEDKAHLGLADLLLAELQLQLSKFVGCVFYLQLQTIRRSGEVEQEMDELVEGSDQRRLLLKKKLVLEHDFRGGLLRSGAFFEGNHSDFGEGCRCLLEDRVCEGSIFPEFLLMQSFPYVVRKGRNEVCF